MSKSPAMTAFTQNIQAILEVRGWTIQDLSDHCGIDRGNLSKIIHQKQRVTLDRAERIANALQVTLSELVASTSEFSGLSA